MSIAKQAAAKPQASAGNVGGPSTRDTFDSGRSYSYQEGSTIDHTPVADVNGGQIIQIGVLFGLANVDIPADSKGALSIAGVKLLRKTSGAHVAGAAVDWSVGGGGVVTTATGDGHIGVVVYDASAEAEHVAVLLNHQLS